MALLIKGKKDDLNILSEELGKNIDPSLKITEL